jgi:rhodanese-related sulfurtransferase
MDPYISAVVVAAALLTLFVMRSFGGKCSPKLARQLVSLGARLIDVRTPAEFAAGHLPGAINVPVGELEGHIEEIAESDTPIVVYCRSGARSARAKRTLDVHGFPEVHDLGAMSRWR